jgi:hypothetical protein
MAILIAFRRVMDCWMYLTNSFLGEIKSSVWRVLPKLMEYQRQNNEGKALAKDISLRMKSTS